MNERIRELAGKALDEAVPETWTTLTAYDLNNFAEKFAELIVRECIDTLLWHGCDEAVPYIEWMAVNKLGVKNERKN